MTSIPSHPRTLPWRVFRAFGELVSALLVTSCTPILPFHFAETASVLGDNQVQITAFGGGGGSAGSNNTNNNAASGSCCGVYGAGARLRMGLGNESEVGIEGAAEFNQNVGAVSGKVAWKHALSEDLALVAGLGGGWINDEPANLGGDLASLHPPRPAGPWWPIAVFG